MFDSKWFELEDYEGEIWKPLVDFEGIYLCSNIGRIKRLPRTWGSGRQKTTIKSIPEAIVKQRVLKDGYVKTTLCKDGVKKSYSVHLLVAKTFIPNPFNKPTVNHKDGNKQNNRVENLEWTTYRENTLHYLYEMGRIKQHRARYNNFTEEEIKHIQDLHENGLTYAEIGKLLNIHKHTVASVCQNISYKPLSAYKKNSYIENK